MGTHVFYIFLVFVSFAVTVAEPHWDPRGPWPPPKYLKILVYIYIYSRVILIKKCYIHNIFTINLKWQVIIDCYVCAKKLLKLWIKIRTNNNLPLRIYREIVVKIL